MPEFTNSKLAMCIANFCTYEYYLLIIIYRIMSEAENLFREEEFGSS